MFTRVLLHASQINFTAFGAAASAAFGMQLSPPIDIFANDVTFLLGAFLFEDIGVTAYKVRMLPMPSRWMSELMQGAVKRCAVLLAWLLDAAASPKLCALASYHMVSDEDVTNAESTARSTVS